MGENLCLALVRFELDGFGEGRLLLGTTNASFEGDPCDEKSTKLRLMLDAILVWFWWGEFGVLRLAPSVSP